MGSQFVDFNADGIIDIVTGTFDGSPHVAYGIKGGFEEPGHILDKNGDRILLGQFWDFPNVKWVDTEKPQCTSAVAYDWDNDGDFDLLLGEYSGGNMYLHLNEGKAGQASFSGKNQMIHAGGKPFELKKGVTTPRLVDWNTDGLMDLVIGSFGDTYTAEPGGGVYLYLNSGKLGAPEFDAAITLLAPQKPTDESQVRPHVGLYADPVDVDGDGDLDLIVGGYSIWHPPTRELNAEETLELSQLRKKQRELQSEQREMRSDLNGLEDDERKARWKEISRSEEYTSVAQALKIAAKRITELSPGRQRVSGVWIYLQNEGGVVASPASAQR